MNTTTRTFGRLEALENRTFRSVSAITPETTPAEVGDINGDGSTNTQDITFLLSVTNEAGDADLNGIVDADDYNALLNGLGGYEAPSWFSGDFNADGSVDAKDESILLGKLFTQGDADTNGVVDSDDYNAFLNGFGGYEAPSWHSGDFNADGKVDTTDESILLSHMYAMGDATCDGVVNSDDYSALLDGISGMAAPSWTSGDFNSDGTVDRRDESILLGQMYKAGDANLDGHVDSDDFAALLDGFSGATEISWFSGDFNADGQVNDLDANILFSNME